MRGRMPCCRGLMVLLLSGILFVSVNVMFLWSQIPPQPCICDCARAKFREAHIDDLSAAAIESPRARNSTKFNASSPATQTVSQKASESDSPSSSSPVDRHEDWGPHQLAVVVPFRNRFEEMLEFVPHIHQFLNRQRTQHQIWVINQADNHRFNRASLLDTGFLLSRNECDYMAMHDIDLLPLNDNLKYSYPEKGPLHVSSPQLHPLYHYKTFVGGILIMSRKQFERVNGLSTLFWGWGREDDELYLRMKEAGMKVQYPQGIKTGYHTFRHIHDRDKRPRDQKRYYNQWDISRRRDRSTGLSTLKYRIVNTVEMTISEAPVNFVNVELECDYELTPFCDTPG